MAVPRDERDINTIYFPDLEGDREREFGNAPAQAKLPARLLIERGARGNKRQEQLCKIVRIILAVLESLNNILKLTYNIAALIKAVLTTNLPGNLLYLTNRGMFPV